MDVFERGGWAATVVAGGSPPRLRSPARVRSPARKGVGGKIHVMDVLRPGRCAPVPRRRKYPTRMMAWLARRRWDRSGDRGRPWREIRVLRVFLPDPFRPGTGGELHARVCTREKCRGEIRVIHVLLSRQLGPNCLGMSGAGASCERHRPFLPRNSRSSCRAVACFTLRGVNVTVGYRPVSYTERGSVTADHAIDVSSSWATMLTTKHFTLESTRPGRPTSISVGAKPKTATIDLSEERCASWPFRAAVRPPAGDHRNPAGGSPAPWPTLTIGYCRLSTPQLGDSKGGKRVTCGANEIPVRKNMAAETRIDLFLVSHC